MSGTTGRWEYHVERIYGEIRTERLNDLGADRWELVSTAVGADNGQVLIFKRSTPTLAEQITIDQRTRVQGAVEGAAS